MRNQGKIAWAQAGILLVICPDCGANHQFEQVDFDKMILGGCAEDEFSICSSGSPCNAIQILWPQFVCRNPGCSFVSTIKLPGPQ